MARKNGDFITGVLGTLVFRVVNGVQVISARTPKGKIRQTEATKVAAKVFGRASSLGGTIRGTVKSQMLGLTDAVAKNNLNGLLADILRYCRKPESQEYEFDTDSFASLKNFELHSKSKVKGLLKKSPAVTLSEGKMKCSFPALDIQRDLNFPYRSFRCSINVSVSLFRLHEGLYERNPVIQTLVLNKNMEKSRRQVFEFNVPDGCLCILSICLMYEVPYRKLWKTVNNKNFNPGKICAAIISEGTYQGGDAINWTEMIKFD